MVLYRFVIAFCSFCGRANRSDSEPTKEDLQEYRFLAAFLFVCFLWFSSTSLARSVSIGGRADKSEWEQGRKDLQEHRSIVGKTFLAALLFVCFCGPLPLCYRLLFFLWPRE